MTDESIHQLDPGDTGVGIVYVLTNPAMQDFVKIGVTGNLQERMRSLDQPSSVPLPFECVYAVKVPNARAWERVLHEVFSESRINRRREFFHSDVTAKAALILQTAKLEDVTHTAPSVAQPDEPEKLKQERSRRENFSFEMLNIPDGELLQFLSDESVVCMVTQQKPPRVLYEKGGDDAHRSGGKGSGAGLHSGDTGTVALEVRRRNTGGTPPQAGVRERWCVKRRFRYEYGTSWDGNWGGFPLDNTGHKEIIVKSSTPSTNKKAG